MTFLARWLVSRNPAMTLAHAKRLATGGLILLGIVLLVGGVLLWDHFDDRAVERKVNLERDNRDLRANIEANETAGMSKVERDTRETAEQEELTDEVDEADAAGRSAADDLWNGGLFDD
jgi:hypothetical protein